jgi:NitT/TauT family transport system substrate-binding protein
MKLRVFTAAIAIVATCLSTVAVADEKVNVRLDFLPWGIHAALQLAAEKGWFKEQGLDVDITDGKGSNVTIQQVATGEVDIGQVQLNAAAIARAKGLPVVSIAGFVRRGDLGALVPVDGGINTVKDLEGRKVAYVAATTVSVLSEPFFAAGGANPKKVDLLNVDAASQMSVYNARTVDAVMITVPLGEAVAETTRPSKGILLSDVGMNLPSYGLITSDKVLKERAPTLQKFVSVSVKAWEYLYSDPRHIDEGVAAIIAQRPGDKLDAVILKRQVELYRAFLDSNATKGTKTGWQSEADWKVAVATLEMAGLLPPGTKPTDYYTNAFVSEK